MSEEYLLHCIEQLLIGLEIQNIDLFMSRLNAENCRNLGESYKKHVKIIIAERDAFLIKKIDTNA